MQDQPISSCLDSQGNKVERFEDGTLRVTLSGRGKRTTADVETWYWRYVGVR